jgi:eukaryotic-like serine/threonine-protein kinase
MPDHRVDAIFDAALDVPPGERTAFLDRECGGDEALRAEVLELLHAYHRSDSVLESPAARVAAPLLDAAIAAPVPGRIGAFRVVREIGRGGTRTTQDSRATSGAGRRMPLLWRDDRGGNR